MAKDKQMCSGCRDDYYNRNRAEGCWMFARAEVVTRMRVGTWQNPPYRWKPQQCLNCYNPDGASMIRKDDCRVVVHDPNNAK